MKISRNEFKSLIKECIQEIICEAQNKVDNFDRVKKLLDFKSNDDFYFVQIIKRWKDNKNNPNAAQEKLMGQQNGTYHGGAWYLTSWRIHSAQELESLRPQIIKMCEDNNARAYISINSRSETETNNYIKLYAQKFSSNDPRAIHANDIIPGQAKSGPNWRDQRLRLFLDIDTPDQKIWNEVRRMLQYYNIASLDEYVTPSGGLHIILANKNNRNLIPFKKELAKFDNFHNMGLNATVHPNEDGKIILYSNVITKGY